ncbi:MAG: phosphoribosylanthranilate isomerase [Pseudomonadota bacterium]
MPADIRVKICGLREDSAVAAAAESGANYIGLNFVPKSPRYVTLDLAKELALAAPIGMAKVGLVVDVDDARLDAILESVPLDMIQLHGAETPARVAEVRQRTGLPVMKAIGIAGADDVNAIAEYAPVADQLLIDTKPPKDAKITGGNGVAFDWTLIAGRRWAVPWMLAGGLTMANVAEAIAVTGAKQVDLSSGVEGAPGVKDPKLIADFIAAARV